jgi:hypothetical protein
MLTDAFLDRFLRDSIADGSAFTPGWQDVIAQAKDANRFRRALLTIAEMGRKEDAKVAAKAIVVEACLTIAEHSKNQNVTGT